jgi:predicted nucleic acid-binding OB-fold protein
MMQESKTVNTKRRNKNNLSKYPKNTEVPTASSSVYMDTEEEKEEEEEYQTTYNKKTGGKKEKQPSSKKVQKGISTEEEPWSEVFNMLNTISIRLTNLENNRGANKKSLHYSS